MIHAGFTIASGRRGAADASGDVWEGTLKKQQWQCCREHIVPQMGPHTHTTHEAHRMAHKAIRITRVASRDTKIFVREVERKPLNAAPECEA